MTLLLFNNLYCVLSCLIQCAQPFATPWTIAHQAPLSMGFSRQEYWSGLLSPPPRDLPDPGIKPTTLKSPALAGGFFTTWEAQTHDWVPIDFHNLIIKQSPTV